MAQQADQTLVTRPNPFQKFSNFLREVSEEFSKVSRPSLPELRDSTTVVIISVLIIGGIVGVMDLLFSRLVQFALR